MTVTWDNTNKIATVSGSTEASPDQLGNVYNAAVAGGGSSNVFKAGNTYQFSDMSISFNGGCLAIYPFQDLFLNRSQIIWGNNSGTLWLYYNTGITYADTAARYDAAGSTMLMNNAGAKFKTTWQDGLGYQKPFIYITTPSTSALLGAKVLGSSVPACIWDITGLRVYLPTTATINFASSAASATLNDIELIDLSSTGGKVYFHKHTLNRCLFVNVNQLGITGNPGSSAGPTFIDPKFYYTSARRLEFLTDASTPGVITFQDALGLSTSWNGKFYNATDRIMFKNTIERRFYDEASGSAGIDVRGQFRSSNSTIGPQQDTYTTSGLTGTTLTSLDSLATTANTGVETTPTVVTWTEDYHPYAYNESLSSRLQSSQALVGGSESTIDLTSVGFTMPSEAAASAYTGIAIDHTSQTITVTSAHTYREIFAYCKYNLRLTANMQYRDFIRTFDGKGFECDYNVVIDGATLTGEGWLTLTGTKTFTTVGTGSLGTGNFATDLNGTYGSGPGGGTTGLTIEDVKTALTEQGYTTARALLLDNLDAAVSSRESETDAASRATTNQSEHDATQAAIAALDTAADNAAAVWDYLTADSVLAGSFGMLIKTNLNAAVGSRQSELNANTRYANLLAEHNDTQALISALDIQGDCQAALDAYGYTSLRSAKLDNLDVAVSTRESETSASTRATNNQSEHDTTQSMISSLTVTVDNNAIAAAVWDYLTSDAITTGSFGLLVKTNLNATISSRQSEVDAATRATNNQNEHDTTQALINALDFTADVQSALDTQGYTSLRAARLDNLDAAISSRESETNAASRATTNQSEHDATQAAIAAINVVTDTKQALTDFGYTSVRAAKLDNLDNLTAAAPTTSEIVIAILDEALAGHDLDGTVGRALRIARDQSTVAANNTQQ